MNFKCIRRVTYTGGAFIIHKVINLVLFLGDIIAILLLLFYILLFHLLSLGSLIFEGIPDETIVLKPSEWFLPVLIVGILTFIYIKFLWGKDNYKRMKIYILLLGFGMSVLFNMLWVILSFDMIELNVFFTQLFVIGVMSFLLFYINNKRKRLLIK